MDSRALRDAFGTFATGVTVVTTRQPDGTPRGFTANSFTSVSLDPPMVLVCIAKSALSCDVFCSADHFAVNVLNAAQTSVSGLFASTATDKFAQVPWQPGRANMPLLDDTLGHFVCARHAVVDAGDHFVVLGRVVDFGARTGDPLGYFRGRYFTPGLDHSLVRAATQGGTVVIGAIAAQNNRILLGIAPDGSVMVPKATGAPPDLNSLTAKLDRAGLAPRLDTLYAVYQNRETGSHAIFYHGTVSGPAPDGMAYFSLDNIPLTRVGDLAERSMLARYVDEFRHGSFGIYQGDETRGHVHRVSARTASKH